MCTATLTGSRVRALLASGHSCGAKICFTTSVCVWWDAGTHSCFLSHPSGDVFFATQPEQFTFPEAQQYCESQNATLASVGQLHAAWKQGLDRCYAGWLADGSLRYPIVSPRPGCGGDAPGVRTVYQHYNQTGFPDPLSRHHAFCFRGTFPPLARHVDLSPREKGICEGG